MNGPHFITCILALAIIFAGAQRPDEPNKYCGFQHADDYFPDSNGTSINEFPWVAGLMYKFFEDEVMAILCAGALINRRYVVTAAQCLTHPQESALILVRLGEWHLENQTDCTDPRRYEKECTDAVDYGIEEKVVHPQYNREKRIHDIALIRLDTIINEFTDFIRPICFDVEVNWYAKIGDILHTSGWGVQLESNEQTEFKKKINTTLISNEMCAGEVGNRGITENHICTRDVPKNTDFTCQGDAGAPVMFVFGRVPQWHLEGITSWGGQCGSQQPQVHTRVSKYIGWFKDTIRD